MQRLDAQKRVAFVEGMCRERAVGVKVTEHTGTVHEAYYDLCLLAVDYGLDLSKACERLERWLKLES